MVAWIYREIIIIICYFCLSYFVDLYSKYSFELLSELSSNFPQVTIFPTFCISYLSKIKQNSSELFLQSSIVSLYPCTTPHILFSSEVSLIDSSIESYKIDHIRLITLSTCIQRVVRYLSKLSLRWKIYID
jgi:hypothetical protein